MSEEHRGTLASPRADFDNSIGAAEGDKAQWELVDQRMAYVGGCPVPTSRRSVIASAAIASVRRCPQGENATWGIAEWGRSLDAVCGHGRDVGRLDFLIVTAHDSGHEAPWCVHAAVGSLVSSL